MTTKPCNRSGGRSPRVSSPARRWSGTASLAGALATVLVLMTPADLSAAPPKSRSKNFAPLPQSVRDPADNPATPEKIALGRQLFFDPRLSGDNRLSCASCHDPEKSLGDGLPRGTGHGGKVLSRNTPTLWNVGFYERFNWDGRAPSLEQQALGPIASPDEMNQDLAELARELAAIPAYADQFQRVFGALATAQRAAQALAAFQRTLVTGPSPFDRYLAGEATALSPDARRGLELFEGEAGCVRCHHGPILSDSKLYRIGVSFRDPGLAAATGNEADRGKFRTPSLRNVALTAPYMHDGSKKTLTEVVEFYYRGVPTSSTDNLRLDVQPLLGQSYSEIPALVAFLESLTGSRPEIEKPR